MFRPGTFLIILIIVGFGVVDFFRNYENNNCEMTYMFEYPEYLRVPMDKKIKKEFPDYGLYLYGEGDYANGHINFKMSGIPFLFIPGNDGSYKQVRSLGSVAYRKWKDGNYPFHLDFFSVDFEEELSAFVGYTLERQTEFLELCIDKILSFYNGKQKSVVLVGHSMGGILARGLLTRPGFERSRVHTIFTQATPHQYPVVTIDYYLTKYYNRVNEYWSKNANTTLSKVSVFSTAGGFRDIQVRRDLTSLRGLVSAETSFDTNSMSVPLGWVSTDHRCHVWCKQIVLSTVRAMFDMIDQKTMTFAVNPKFRQKVILHHFFKHSGSKNYKAAYKRILDIPSDAKLEKRPKSSWKYARNEVNVQRIFQSNVSPHDKFSTKRSYTIMVKNFNNERWVGGCLFKDVIKDGCKEFVNLAPYAELVPPVGWKVLNIDSSEIEKYSSIITAIPKGSRDVKVYSELFLESDRFIEWEQPTNIASTIKTFLFTKTLIEKTEKNALFYNFTLSPIEHVLHVFKVSLTNLECTKDEGEDILVRIHTQWISDDQYLRLHSKENSSFVIRLASSKPNVNLSSQVHIYLNTQCRYKIEIGLAISELFGQFFRFYMTCLPSALASMLIFLFSDQFTRLCSKDSEFYWPNLLKILPITLIVNWLLGTVESSSVLEKLYIPLPDWVTLQEQGLWFSSLYMYTSFIALSFLSLSFCVSDAILNLFNSIINRIFKTKPNQKESSKLSIFYLIAIFCSNIVTVFLCGSMGLLFAVPVLLIQHISEENYKYLPETAKNDGVIKTLFRKRKLRLLIIYMLIFVAILTAPSLIHFVRGSKSFQDPWKMQCLTISISLLLIEWADVSSLNGQLAMEFIDIASGSFYIGGHVLFIYASVSLYRIVNIISFLMALFAVVATLSRFLDVNMKTKTKKE